MRATRCRRLALALTVVITAGCSGGDGEPAPTTSTLPPGAGPVAPGGPIAAVPGEPDDVGATGRFTRVAAFDDTVTGVVSVPGGDELLVALQSGIVRRIRLERRGELEVPVVDPEPVLDVSARTAIRGEDGEGGLISLALTPDGGRLLLDYAALDGAITVRAWPYTGAGSLDEAAGVPVVTVPHPYPSHNGGGMAFDATGGLLLSVGDMGLTRGTPAAQDPASPLGAVLRLSAEQVATGVGDTPDWRALVVAKGLRNPYRISYDALRDVVWIGDVGEDRYEEIDALPLGSVSTGPPNFGWPFQEGPADWEQEGGPEPDPALRTSRPALSLDHGESVCAVIGGVVYGGSAVPGLRGAYLYADNCSGQVQAAVIDSGLMLSRPWTVGGVEGALVTFGTGPAGEVYVADRDGAVYRLDERDWQGTDVSAPRSRATTTTEAAPSLATAACEIDDTLARIGELVSAPSADLTADLDREREALSSQIAALPAELLDDGATLLEGVDRLRMRLPAGASAADAASAYADVTAGKGEFSEFPAAYGRVGEALTAGCR